MRNIEVLSSAEKIVDAAVCLMDGGHQIPAIMLTYVGIDQMCWLSIKTEKSCGDDFVAWVDNFMLPHYSLPCTAKELWAARNGLLHMGTAESSAIKKNTSIRKIFYVYGSTECTRNDSTDTVIVRVENLIGAFATGAYQFLQTMNKDSSMASVALEKLGRTLISRGPDQRH